MPDGKRIAVNLGADFDAQAIWLGSFNMPIQSLMQRGQFGAEVGLPRLLEVWERYGEMTSVFAPGTRSTPSPRSCVAWSMAGTRSDTTVLPREPTKISRETEKKLIQLGLNAFRNQLGVRPLGYRAPYWEHSESTLDLVEEFGFKYDSSLMGRDLQAYHPQRWQIIGRRTTSLVGSAGSSKSLLAGTSMTFRCSPIRTPSAASRTPTRS
jgi:hypothetical protein